MEEKLQTLIDMHSLWRVDSFAISTNDSEKNLSPKTPMLNAEPTHDVLAKVRIVPHMVGDLTSTEATPQSNKTIHSSHHEFLNFKMIGPRIKFSAQI